jgi:hypothetical protein
MRSRYVVVMGTCLLPVLFGCTSDDSASTTSGSAGSGGAASTTSTTSAGGTAGSGGTSTTSTTGGGGGSSTTGGGTAGDTGSGGSSGGSSSDGGGSCNSACDCPTGFGCFNNKCSTDFFAYCCSSDACKPNPDAICQRTDKTWSTCGSAADGGKDNIDFCPYFGCASGQACPPGCTCGMNDLCKKM